MTLAINKADGYGLSNTVCYEHLTKKTKTKFIPAMAVIRWSASVIKVSG